MSTGNKNLLNMIFLGEVASVHHYGAFVKVPGSRNQGLVHRSQISNSNVDDASDVLQTGEKVWCKVINFTDDGKMSLSMKVVDQGGGKDLDPNGVQVHQDEQRRRERPTNAGRKKIELGAILNTTCSKCGTRGHMSKDCFKDPSGKTYELLPEEDEEDTRVVPKSSKSDVKDIEKKNKKSKKIKKEKRKDKKKRHHSSSLSESSDDDSKKKKMRKSSTHYSERDHKTKCK